MDRSWMSKDRMSREYEEGVEYFINFALEHCPNQRGIRCPCMRCGNLIHHTPNKIREHMFFNGIDQSYCTWYWHGEAGPTSSQPTEMAQRYDTMDCGDVASTVEMVHAIEDEFMTDPMSFKKLLEDAEKPLYPSCIKFTKLSALVKLYNVKARYGWSDKSFSDLLQILGDMLPVNNEMPLSMYEAKKTLNALGMEYKKIHACPNDCILYRNELNEASSCPTCGMSRFKRMFQSPKIAKDLKWHAQGRENNGKLRHPVDSPQWQLVNQMWPEFASDCRNLRLAISADGINPHSSMTRPRQPGKDIDVYLAPLVDDLKTLWEVGVKAYDAHQQEFFTLKAILLWTINDFPAYGNLSGCTVKGYYACPICGEETNSHWLKHGNKNSYTGHRRFLPCNHPFRKQKKAFNGEQEFRLPPKELTGDEIFTKVDMIHNSWGKKKRLNNVNPLLIRQVAGKRSKTKDGVKSRLDLLEMGLRPDLAPRFGLKRTYLPPACYTLSRKEKKIVLQTLADLKVPEGYCSNFRNLVSMEELKLNGLKSHDYHALMQQLLPVAIRSVLPKHVRYAITRLCFFFNALCAKVVDVSRLNDIQQDIVVTLCLLEKYFPPSIFDIMLHLTVHLVREVRLCGPVYMRWMYPFERYMKVLKGYVRNHNRPEGCIAECYIAEEALEFCTEYLSGMDAIGIPSSMKDEWKCGKPLLGDKISSSIKESKWLEDEHVRTFSHWLRKKVSDDISKKEPIEKELKWLAQGPRQQVLTYPGYIIHGCRYHIKNRDEARVNQNSGVSIVASTMQIASSKDKNPVLGDMCFYGIITEIWDLDYNMFNICVFKCDWVDSKNGVKVDELGFTLVDLSKIGHKSDPFILATQANKFFM
ncbi:hypothetical protein CK203_056355 [Vitis vinifera]|uniref:Transposase-associated domain-containing protein n=1 Tax=Vitis vinifera TaxID=29760 RepID=A0A438GL46_VITVI|nr:hypothetical protein CK203_056355 [Vitis vinifera]